MLGHRRPGSLFGPRRAQKAGRSKHAHAPASAILNNESLGGTPVRACDMVKCAGFPCQDIQEGLFVVPGAEIEPDRIKVMLICEAPPPDPKDYFYAGDDAFYLKTTLQAFQDAGVDVANMADVLQAEAYVTTAVKCGKTRYAISTDTIRNCSAVLEQEISLFPNVQVYLLMGDVAIKAVNYISRRQTGKVVIPPGSTYKIRGGEFSFRGKPALPSYTPTGHNYLIEKSKRRMIAEDIRKAFDILNLEAR